MCSSPAHLDESFGDLSLPDGSLLDDSLSEQPVRPIGIWQ